MANSDKNIVIQPSIGSTVDQPSITFTGAGNSSITLKVLDDAEGTLSFEGYEGQVFAINNNLSSGVIYSVNDISGFPIIDADASGNVRLSVYSGNVGVGTTLATQKLDVNGTVKATAFSGDGSALTNVTATTAGTATTATFLGQDADGNIFGGTNAGGGYDPVTGTSLYNIFLGENAGAAIANGDYNTFLGYEAGCSVTTGIHNIIFGCRAGCSLQSGSCNVFLGQSAASAATGSSNFVSGHEAGKCMTSGSGNILLTQGASADFGAAWTGSNTVAIGKQAGRRLCGASNNNVFLGKYAGLCVTTGGSNIFIGDEAGCGSNAKTGTGNLALGTNSGSDLSTGANNIFLGALAGKCNTTGTCNIFIGCSAGCGSNAKTGTGNLALGTNAGSNLSTADYNVLLGAGTGSALCTGGYNVFAGTNAGYCVTTGSCNIFLGSYVGKCSTGSNNVFIGRASGRETTGGFNLFLGNYAGKLNTSGQNNIMMGCCAGHGATTACCNIFIGPAAASSGTVTGNDNVVLGREAGKNLCSGATNILFGPNSGFCVTTGQHNVFLGHSSGYCQVSGTHNIFLGQNAACDSTAGNNNIVLGCNVRLPNLTGNDQLAIGKNTSRWIAGDSSFNVTLTGAPGTGIVTAYTDAGLHVSGIVTATSSIVGAAVTINSTGINVTGIVTATSFEGDGSALTNLPASASSGEFYTGITSSIQIKPLSYQTTVHTFPSTAGRQYVIESISVANIDTSVGVGTTVNIIASIEDATAAEQTYIAYNVPIVNGGLIELLKNPIVAGPSDVIKMWTTNGSYIGTSNAVDVYMNYTNFESTEYKKVYAANTTLNATGETDIYTSSTYPTVFESIHFANRTDSGDYPISVTITNGTTTTYLAKDLVIPRYSTVDILDRHKRIETDAVIAVSIAQTGSIDVILAGKQITS